MAWIKVMKEAAMVILLATALAGAGYVIRPAVTLRVPGDSATNAGDENGGAILEITLEEARRYFEQGTALFVDARPQGAYRSGHIQGAIHLDPAEFDVWSGDFFSQTPPDQLIITYCEGARCMLSLDLAEKLTWMGYEKVFHLKNGWGLWNENQLPTEHNSD